MNRIEYKLMQVAETVSGAVSNASDTAFTIVAGQVAGVGADWIDKLFLTEEDGSHYKLEPDGDAEQEGAGQVRSLDRKRAARMAKKLSKNVSTPPDLII